MMSFNAPTLMLNLNFVKKEIKKFKKEMKKEIKILNFNCVKERVVYTSTPDYRVKFKQTNKR